MPKQLSQYPADENFFKEIIDLKKDEATKKRVKENKALKAMQPEPKILRLVNPSQSLKKTKEDEYV